MPSSTSGNAAPCGGSWGGKACVVAMARPQSARRQAEGEEQWPLDQPFQFRRRTSTSRAMPSPRPGRPTRRCCQAAVRRLADFEDAPRGFIAPLPEVVVRTASGTVIWSLEDYAFLADEQAPDTVNPSLWRQARLNMNNGLFQVTDRIYQVRGFDISNMTIIEGDRGLIVIDPLISTEIARAGLELYFQHRGRRPVTAVIYSHSHVDHFGGVRGVDRRGRREGRQRRRHRARPVHGGGDQGERAGRHADDPPRHVPVRRALLPKGPRGQVDAGLGKVTSRGTVTLIPPTQSHRGSRSSCTRSTASR